MATFIKCPRICAAFPIKRKFIEDKELSLEAKGLLACYACLLDKKESFHLTELQEEFNISDEDHERVVDELENFGYITRTYDKNGKFLSTLITFDNNEKD